MRICEFLFVRIRDLIFMRICESIFLRIRVKSFLRIVFVIVFVILIM